MALALRRIDRSRRLIAVALGLLIVGSAATAQSPDGFSELVERYMQGDASAAVAAFARWPPDAVKRAGAAYAERMAAASQRAAVMLHTDAAYALLLSRSNQTASTHLTQARRLFAALKHGGHGDERTQRFEARWFAFVASMYTSQLQFDSADEFVRDGLVLYPRDARLLVARGAIREMGGTVDTADGGRAMVRGPRRWLDAAAADFRRALSFDDTLAVAHLHLGWVRFLQGDDRSSVDFAAALARADDDDTRYLAHLFLGAFAVGHERLEDARTHDEAALRLGPKYQTAYVALSNVEEALGRSARARELAHMYVGLRDKQEDPWWNYHLGSFDQASLIWLRREARTP